MESKAGLAWLLLAMVMLSLGLGEHALIDPDEGRNAVIVKEMAASGDVLFPRLNGLPFLDKPFLYFAVGAVSVRALGSSELALRVPSLLFAWATILLTAWFSARLFGRRTAWVAGTACAATSYFFFFSRTVIFDSTLSFFVACALVSFYLAVEHQRAFWAALAWVAMALGVFTKGPVALLLPLLVAVPYALWRRRPRAVVHPAGWLAFAALVAPWLVMTEWGVPGFLRYALVTETWGRLTSDAMDRSQPLWFFVPILFLGTFPWLVVAAANARRWMQGMKAGADRRALVFLALWIVLPFVFFSLSQSKRPVYLLPVVPGVALVVAWSWGQAQSRWSGARSAAVAWLAFAAVFILFWVGVGANRVSPELTESIAIVAPRLAVVTLFAAVGGWILAANRTLAPMALSVPLVFFPAIMAPLTNAIAEGRSARLMADIARKHMTPETAIVGVEAYSPSLSFYLDRPIEVSTPAGVPFRVNSIEHFYSSLVGAGFSPLQPGGAWRSAVGECARPILLLAPTELEPELREAAATGLPQLYSDDKYALFGPCRPPDDSSGPVPTPAGDEIETVLR